MIKIMAHLSFASKRPAMQRSWLVERIDPQPSCEACGIDRRDCIIDRSILAIQLGAMPAQEYFSSDFDTARGKFLAACDTAGFPVTSFRHPGSASLVAKLGLPEALSGNLFVDVARAGSPDATRVLVLCPGDSESEGLFASAINVAWLASGAHRHLSKPMAVVMIHAITPDGVSWARIVAEASGEERKSKWSDATLAAAEERFAAYAEAQGLDTSFAQTEQTEARRFRWPDDM